MAREKPVGPPDKSEMIRAVYRGDANYTFVRAIYEPGGYFGWRQPAWQLVVLIQGRVKIVVEGETVWLEEGEGILMHPGWEVLYLFDQEQRSIHTGCQIESSLFQKEELALLEKVRGVHRVPAAVHILIGEGLNAPLTAGGQLHEALAAMARACLLRFAASVAESNPSGLPPHSSYSRALQLLETDPRQFKTADALARRCSISVSRLRQIFRQAGAESPSAMLWRIKIEHAVQMIRSTRLTLGEIADQSGFTNPFHLSRSVKKHTGLAPREIRRTEHGSAPASANALE